MARPENDPKTPLGRRIREVRAHFRVDDRDAFAGQLGISKAALAYYERGERTPDASVLAAYREVFGVNVSWLVTGLGEMFDDPSKAPAPSNGIDPLLMEKLYKAVERAYKDAGQRPPGHRIAHEATRLLNVLLARVTDVRDDVIVDAVIPKLAEELVERLSSAVAEPGTGKRLA